MSPCIALPARRGGDLCVFAGTRAAYLGFGSFQPAYS